MKAHRLPSGSWRVKVQVNGKSYSVTESTEDEAIYQAMLIKTGRVKLDAPAQTVGDCLDEYIRSKENVLSPKTIYVYKQIRSIHLAEIADIPVSELTNPQIQAMVNKLALRKSPKTVHNAHSLLVSVLTIYAPELRVHTTLPKIPKKIKQLPSAEELMKAIIGSDIELPCLLALWLGLRLSEIRGAKKSDITDGVLLIHDTIITVGGKHIEKHNTKTAESTRLLVLPEHLQSLISALPEDQDYLTLLSGQAIYKRFKRLLRDNNLPDMTFHDLRHMNASVMLALGIPDKYAMERGGWSSDKVMKSVYQHTFTSERQKVDAMIDDYFNDILFTKVSTNNQESR